jgi:hypothetical protein
LHVSPDIQDGCRGRRLGLSSPVRRGREKINQLLSRELQEEILRDVRSMIWSGWRDLNARLLRPERSALPDWATSRHIWKI